MENQILNEDVRQVKCKFGGAHYGWWVLKCSHCFDKCEAKNESKIKKIIKYVLKKFN